MIAICGTVGLAEGIIHNTHLARFVTVGIVEVKFENDLVAVLDRTGWSLHTLTSESQSSKRRISLASSTTDYVSSINRI